MGRIRGYLKCIDCGRNRNLYSRYMQKSKTGGWIQYLAENANFTCGSVIEIDDNEVAATAINGILYTNISLTCEDPIEWTYFTHTTTAIMPKICCHCGGPTTADDILNANIMAEKLGTVLPYCRLERCQKIGPRYRRTKKVGNKRKIREAKVQQRSEQQHAKKKRKSTDVEKQHAEAGCATRRGETKGGEQTETREDACRE